MKRATVLSVNCRTSSSTAAVTGAKTGVSPQVMPPQMVMVVGGGGTGAGVARGIAQQQQQSYHASHIGAENFTMGQGQFGDKRWIFFANAPTSLLQAPSPQKKYFRFSVLK